MSNQLPLLAGALAGGILIGGVVGFVSHSVFAPPPAPEVILPAPEVIEKQLSDEDLARLCQNLTADEKTRATDAVAKVSELRGALETKQAELDKLPTGLVPVEEKGAAVGHDDAQMTAVMASFGHSTNKEGDR